MSPTSLLLLLSLAILNPLPGSDPADDDIREDLLEARDNFEQKIAAASLGTIHPQANRRLEFHPNTGRYRFASQRDRAAEVARLSDALKDHQFAVLSLADFRHGRFGALPASDNTAIYRYRILRTRQDLVLVKATCYTDDGAINGLRKYEFLIQGPTAASLTTAAIFPKITGYYVVKVHHHTTLEGTTRVLPLLRELEIDFDDLAEQRDKGLKKPERIK